MSKSIKKIYQSFVVDELRKTQVSVIGGGGVWGGGMQKFKLF